MKLCNGAVGNSVDGIPCKRELEMTLLSFQDQETKWQPKRNVPSAVRRDQTGFR